MIWVDAEASHEVFIAAGVHAVFSFVTDVARTARYFPGMKNIDAIGGGIYAFELAERRTLGQTLKGEFTARYEHTSERRLEWSTVAGNMRSQGHWQVEPRDKGTLLSVRMQTGFELAAPGLLRAPISLFARFETQRCLEAQLAALRHAIEGERGGDAERLLVRT